MDKRLTKELQRRGVPSLYAQEEEQDTMIYLEITTSKLPWRWFVAEARLDSGDVLFFGFVGGDFPEWGYFQLSELESVGPIIVNYGFRPKRFSEVKKEYGL